MAAYPIPPWLNVTPQDFGEAAYKGATIRMERARLAQQAQESQQRAGIAAAELSAKTAAQQQANLREQQEMEISRAMEQAQLGLKTRALDQEEQKINLQVESATRKSAAQQEAAARIRAGEEPSKVWAELGPSIGLTGAGLAAAIKPKFQFRGAEDVPGAPDLRAIQTSPEQYRVMPKKGGAPESVTSVPILDDNGNPLPGVRGVPNASGGTTVIHLPQPTTGTAINKLIEERRQNLAGGSGGAQSGAPLPSKAAPAAAPKKARPSFSAIPQGAKEYLIQHPETASHFDEKYGEGMAEIILGPGH